MRLLSLNVEQDKHLHLVGPFIELEKADVVALMEVCEDNIDTLLPEYPYRKYAPNFHMNGRKLGVVVAAREPLTHTSVFYADGKEGNEVPPHGLGTHRPVAVTAMADGVSLTAVHFTWTPNMSETDQQHADLDRLISRLQGEEIVLCGDFNIPRGNSTYQKLVAHYRDNIPAIVMTTIDPKLHRANFAKNGTLQVVVDYVWSTPRYQVDNVRIIEGVSDHCGVVADIDIV